MILDIVFITGQTFSLEIKSAVKNRDGSYVLTLPDNSTYTFNPHNALLWSLRKGNLDDKAEKSSTLSS